MTGADPKSTGKSGAGDEKSPADQLVELLVYAPVGMLYEYQTVMEQVVKRGRSQVQLAKVMGKMAAQRGQNDVEENVGEVLSSAAETIAKGITEFGAAIGLAPPKTSSADDTPEEQPAKEAATEKSAPKTAGSKQPEPASKLPLPIAGYDELKAREIISLLPDLDRDQRARLAKHERENRNRKTVLAKLDQLEG